MQLDFNELRELLTAIGQTDIAELTLKSGEWELTVRKSPSGLAVSPAVAPHPNGNEGITAYTAAPLPVAPTAPGDAATTPASSGTEASAPSVSPPAIETKYETIASPMVGTFYRAVAPGEPSFVEVGDRIKNGQTVCIIEAFKVMNELEAELSGEIVEILVENGQAVEFGQTLMRVKP